MFAPTLFTNFNSNCNIVYYGKTKRHLKIRTGEHISMSTLTKNKANNNKTFVVKDCLLPDHVCWFDDFTIFSYESHKFKRLIKESLLVTKDKLLLNKQVKSPKLELRYYTLDDLKAYNRYLLVEILT